jgi:hypothetical protein
MPFSSVSDSAVTTDNTDSNHEFIKLRDTNLKKIML